MNRLDTRISPALDFRQNCISISSGNYSLSSNIIFWYGNDAVVGRYDDKFFMASPTLFKNDVTYPINFAIPEDPAYEAIYPNSEGPWLFSSRVPDLFGDWWSPYYCYPEPMAYP